MTLFVYRSKWRLRWGALLLFAVLGFALLMSRSKNSTKSSNNLRGNDSSPLEAEPAITTPQQDTIQQKEAASSSTPPPPPPQQQITPQESPLPGDEYYETSLPGDEYYEDGADGDYYGDEYYDEDGDEYYEDGGDGGEYYENGYN